MLLYLTYYKIQMYLCFVPHHAPKPKRKDNSAPLYRSAAALVDQSNDVVLKVSDGQSFISKL